MKCFWCKRDINRGTELAKAIGTYQQPDGTTLDFGWDRPAGKLAAQGGKPTGKLVRMAHYKCYRVAEKREMRGGDAVTGRGMGNIPTAYEITALTANLDELKMLGLTEEEARAVSTRGLSEQVTKARAMAREAGTNAEDPSFKERIRAELMGGPYPHTHGGSMIETFRIAAHLEAAHGITDVPEHYDERLQRHNEDHARLAQEEIAARRSQDPGYETTKETDWRDQEVREVGEIELPDPGAMSSGEELKPEDLFR